MLSHRVLVVNVQRVQAVSVVVTVLRVLSTVSVVKVAVAVLSTANVVKVAHQPVSVALQAVLRVVPLTHNLAAASANVR
jgi:hypothetical protein